MCVWFMYRALRVGRGYAKCQPGNCVTAMGGDGFTSSWCLSGIANTSSQLYNVQHVVLGEIIDNDHYSQAPYNLLCLIDPF